MPCSDRQALKRIINAQRPANARKADPGMPSSHANSEWRKDRWHGTGVRVRTGYDTMLRSVWFHTVYQFYTSPTQTVSEG